jgi:TolB-like protein/Flp pilus assembly protein TadD
MAKTYRLGPFRLDAEAQVLFRGTDPLPLGHRAVALLRVLVEHPVDLISKDMLIEAAWAGLAVEESNLTVQIAALRRVLAEEPGGDRWIETLPRRGYRFVGPLATVEDKATPALSLHQKAPPLPDRPSIAVLPFQNLSGDPAQDYFADGMVEDIIGALSRIRWLFVIARNSSFTYKGRSVDVKQVGRELGVRYVLEGSVRKVANRVRISGELIDASNAAHLWADRFDGSLDDIFDLQDRVSASVAGAIGPKLEQAEIERAKRKPTENLDAYDYFLRGMANVHSWTRDSNDIALRLFYKAIELDAEFATAHGTAAYCYVLRKLNGWMTERQQEIPEAVRLARRAVELGRDDAVALSRGGHALGLLAGDLDSAVAFVDRALWLNPNLAAAWFLSGWVRIFRGESETAIERFERAMRLSPLDPILCSMQNGIGFVHFLAGRYAESSLWAEKSFREQPNYLPATCVTAASHALAGRPEQARLAMARLRQIDPTLRVSNLGDWYPLRRAGDLAKLQEGLRRAGLPA